MSIYPYSFSQISKFEDCPYKYFLSYVAKVVCLEKPFSSGVKYKQSIEVKETGEIVESATFYGNDAVELVLFPKMRNNGLVEGNTLKLGNEEVKIIKSSRLPSPRRTSLNLGSAVHNFAEDYAQHCLDNKVAQDLDWVDQYVEWQKNTVNGSFVFDFEYICRFFARTHSFGGKTHSTFVNEAAFAVNRNWEPVDPDSPDCWIVGHTDSLEFFADDTAEITDYKTDRETKSQAFVDQILQLPLYAVMLLIWRPGISAVNVVYDYVRNNDKVSLSTGPITRDCKIFKDTKLRTERLIASIEAERRWEPAINDWCGYCELAENCDKLAQYEAATDLTLKVSTPADAKNCAMTAQSNSLKTSAAKKRLKAYIEKHGAVPIVNNTYAYVKNSDTWKVPLTQSVWDDLSSLGADMGSVTMSKTTLEAALKKQFPNPAARKIQVDRILGAYGKKNTTTSLKIDKNYKKPEIKS